MVASDLMQTDLSVWGMYQHADIVVKVVMIGLLLASVVTWAIFFGKYAELSAAKRRLKREQLALGEARSLNDAARIAQSFTDHSHSVVLLNDAQNELTLSAGVEDTNGIKDRTSFRLERRVAPRAIGRPGLRLAPSTQLGQPQIAHRRRVQCMRHRANEKSRDFSRLSRIWRPKLDSNQRPPD